MAAEPALRVRGRGTSLREASKELLGNSQKPNTTHNIDFVNLGRRPALHWDEQQRKSLLLEEENEISTIEDLEESLRKLKVQVDSLASGLTVHPDQDYSSALEPSPLSSEWYPSGSRTETEWLLKAKHLARSLDDNLNLMGLAIPTLNSSPPNETSGFFGTVSRNSPALGDLSVPLKLGAPHVIGVKSLLPPKFPVRACLPERSSFTFRRGRSLSHSEVTRSCSFSPDAKRPRWFQARSQSPRPIWRPTSAKANACAQPPPQLGKPRGVRKKSVSSRPSRLRFFRPGTLASKSWTSTKADGQRTPRESWSPYSLASSDISSPTAEEINKRFLQTLSESTMGRDLIEMSPYQKELARLRLERLRVEEGWLLELKRQQELERTRGPRPKWYEMRDSQFHYEAHKNNKLLRSSPEIQSVFDYRGALSRASKEFQQEQKPTSLKVYW
ncbi:uncharacterized protein LOC117675850 [Pantherophis guttatus]|uniref:Uncharacterized protein LOC117675850 n=1 Tax=Pantherophis guttatus TaxID=94885 RepID=A0A6P9DEP4_PANGU|nr:uncharacterized protein LOC117675850 [Pantherophis guttatus]XP_034290772.1 uncharacterized protein LOC117675850 [Pantherophis guttatus]XP_034290773.1 uncharacterized protein LOC117675850 [Pantherophis guttatus]XP_034290774.1 uncharacterized protein LOC117675850 [Pantherophis guttatus]